MRWFLPKGLREFAKELFLEGEHRHVFVTGRKNLNLSPGQLVINDKNELKSWLSENKDKAVTISFSGDAGINELDGDHLGFDWFREINCEASGKEFLISNLKCETIVSNGSSLSLRNVSTVFCRFDLREVALQPESCTLGCLSLINSRKMNNSSIMVDGGKIYSLRLDAAFAARDARFVNVSFSQQARREDSVGAERFKYTQCEFDRASIASLHDWATSCGNSEVAHLARGLELSIENATAVGVDRFFLSAWRVFSQYGLSPMRPLVWLLGFFFAFATLLFFSGTSVGSSDLVGWRSFLSHPSSCYDEIRIAMIGAAEGIVSPLSVLSVRRLVVPDLAWVAMIQVVYNYLCLAMVFLFGFSVRRRFKLS